MAPRVPEQVLKRYWGYDTFREPQKDVIQAVLAGQDCLLVMATGGGKSITYQVPPLVAGSVAIVISPLISLMEDQVAALQARGISAAFLGSAQGSSQVKADAWAGKYDFVYLTPELANGAGDRLRALHARRTIGLIAVDEAHCVCEWGFDFRPEYSQLGGLRSELPGVPLLALTATATPAVQAAIIQNLRMRPGNTRKFVMSFQRPNLRLAAEKRVGGFGDALHDVLARKKASGPRAPFAPTLIYALTTNQVDDIAEFLSAPDKFGPAKVARYHAKLSAGARREAHAAFMRDDAEVMVATVAYGMGIDKPNVRHIVHWGAPSSLEAYYQQAGRAGRDGAQSSCMLLWSPQDLGTHDRLNSGKSGQGRDAYEKGVAAMNAYCTTAHCRHAVLTNYFAAPGSADVMPVEGPCTGGCDSCENRAANLVKSKDVGPEARQLLGAVAALNGHYGLGKALHILRGTGGKSLPDKLKGHALFGGGKARSEDWWKGLAGLLVGEGMLGYKSVQAYGGNSYSAAVLSGRGASWLAGREQPLVLALPAAMNQDEVAAARLEEAHRKSQAASQQTAVVRAQRAEEAAEQEGLLVVLRETRKEVADSLGIPPDTLVSEGTLLYISSLRPSTLDKMGKISGMSEAALEKFGPALLDRLVSFLATCTHLKHDAADWNVVERTSKMVKEIQGPGGASYEVDDAGVVLARALSNGVKGAASSAAAKYETGMSLTDIVKANDRPIKPETIIGYLADAAIEGVLTDLHRLALDVRLTAPVACDIAAAIEAKAASGLRAIKDMLDPAIEYCQIKVVAAMMANRAVWFCAPGAAAAAGRSGAAAGTSTAAKTPAPSGKGAMTGTPGSAAPSVEDDDDFFDQLDDDMIDMMVEASTQKCLASTQKYGIGASAAGTAVVGTASCVGSAAARPASGAAVGGGAASGGSAAGSTRPSGRQLPSSLAPGSAASGKGSGASIGDDVPWNTRKPLAPAVQNGAAGSQAGGKRALPAALAPAAKRPAT